MLLEIKIFVIIKKYLSITRQMNLLLIQGVISPLVSNKDTGTKKTDKKLNYGNK